MIETATIEGAMKDDAFDDVQCPFNYKAELKRARRALNAKVGKYISDNPMSSYRELAKKFHISLGTLTKIARRYESKRKPGPQPGRARRTIASKTVPVVPTETTHTE